MTKITKLDRAALQNLRDPIAEELKALGERLGITFQLGNGTYGAGAEASYKLIMKVDDPATKVAAAKAQWDANCTFIGIDYSKPNETGLRAADFGTEFEYGGATMRTTGIAISGKNHTKFPILVEIVKAGPRGGSPGEVRMLPETAVPLIRAATDAKAPAQPAPAGKKAKAAA